MIVSKNTNPERDYYFLGAILIEIVSKDESIDFVTAYDLFKKETKMSYNAFLLTLNWLYLIGAIEKTNNGVIVKCF